MDEVKPVARVPTAEHREPCESRGSRTDLGAPGGEIPPGDSTKADNPYPAKVDPCPLWSKSGQTRAQLDCPLCANRARCTAANSISIRSMRRQAAASSSEPQAPT